MTTTDDRGREFDERPWGAFTVLDGERDYKVKRIEVAPGKRLSYQRHKRRAEHWFVVRGVATVVLDGESRDLAPGESVDIAIGQAHRCENHGATPVVFIEVQTGTYFGEDDIERLEDDFGRAG
jgi:mannose-6-phosphate isomerase-like protein (cupin superfamily)